MTQKDLIRLKCAIDNLFELCTGCEFAFEADSGRVMYVSSSKGSYDFEELIKGDESGVFDEVEPLVKEINELMEDYIHTYGKFSPELRVH